jgi:hypothetical protein
MAREPKKITLPAISAKPMELPSLDYTNEESLQASAEARASSALIAADAPFYFKGMGMRLTVSIKSLFFMLRNLDGAGHNEDLRDDRDTIILLYLMTQSPTAWNEPVEKMGRTLQPLRSRPADWLGVIDAWADEILSPGELSAAAVAVETVWNLHHVTRMVSDNAGVPSAEKKTVKSRGKSESPRRPAKS